MLDSLMIDLDIKSLGFILFSILAWSLATQNLIGFFKRELYSANTLKKEGIKAIIWGLGYFCLFAAFGSFSLLIFSDYGYDKAFILGLSIVVLIISLPLGFLYERYLRLNYLPIYDEEQAATVTYRDLPSALQSLLSKDDIKLILVMEFEYQQKIGLVGNIGEGGNKPPVKINEQELKTFIAGKAREKGKNYTLEQISAVLKAEESYLKQIRIIPQTDYLSNVQLPKPNPSSVLTPLLGTGVWRLISVGMIVGVIIFGWPYINNWFYDAIYLKESIFSYKLPFETALETVPYYEQIRNNYPSYVKLDNLDISIQIAYAQYYLDQKKFDQALDDIKKALEKDPEFLPAVTTYGHYFIDKEEISQAIEKYQLALKIDKNIPVVNASLCWAYYSNLEIEKAIDYCQKALQLDPKYGLVHGYLVRLYSRNGDHQKATESYKYANRYDVDESYVHYYAAFSHKELDQLAEAGVAVSKSLSEDPKNMDAYILSSEIIYLQGDKIDAIERLERVSKANPKEIRVLDYLGTLYTLEGRFQETIQIYQKAAEVSKDDFEKARIYESLGLIYHDNTKQYNLAEEAFKKAIEYDPKQASPHINLGETYRAKGMLKEAEDQQRIALQLAPEDALAHNNLGYALALQGNITEAIAEFNKALEIDPNLKIAQENLEIFKKK